VQFVPGTRLDDAAVREYGGDLVVIATVSAWAADGLNGMTRGPLPGSSLPHVLTPEQVMVEGKRPQGTRVLVYDCDGYVVAAGLAETLHGEGYQVELSTPFDHLVPLLDEVLEGALVREHLRALGIAVRAGTTLCEVTPDGARGKDAAGSIELEADAVVLVTQRVAEESLFLELESDPDRLAASGVTGLYRIGDCLPPRQIADTIFDGHRIAREIDLPDPSVPKPFLREGFWDRAELAVDTVA
jgi:dimethylamine/trimethylamine dehydrogenase